MYYLVPQFTSFQVLTFICSSAIIYIVDSLKYSDYEIYGTEVSFDDKSTDLKPIKLVLNNGKKVEIIGKIDRIDLAKTENGNYFRIIDYKSSIKDLKLEDGTTKIF